MKFEITLYPCSNSKTINWHLTSEFSLIFKIPLIYFLDESANLELDSDLVRREGASVHTFLTTLNNAYHQSSKFKHVSIIYHDTSEHKNTRISDNFLEGFSLANYTFNRYKKSVDNHAFNIKTASINLSFSSTSFACGRSRTRSPT